MSKISRMLFRAKSYIRNPFCFWCGGWMRMYAKSWTRYEEMATIEHLQAKNVGGSNSEENLVLVHKRCNR